MMKTISQQRKESHQAIRKIAIQNPEQAIPLFQNTLEEMGPHLGLLCDYAGCYYELGRFQECWNLTQQIAKEYFELETLLSQDSKRRTALMLSKFFEEMAEPAQALQWLGRAFDLCTSEEERKWILANELRLLSYFGIKKDLQKKYLLLLEIYNSSTTLKVEILHALSWTEWALFGFQHASQRWEELLKIPLNLMDRRLVHRDYLEMMILSGINVADINQAKAKDQAQSELKSLQQLDYDTALLSLLSDFKMELKNLQWDSLKLSTMMRLRLLLLLFPQFQQQPDQQLEILKKFNFIVSSLSFESQNFFKKILPSISKTDKVVMTLPVVKKILVCSHPQLEMKLTSLQHKLLTNLNQGNIYSLEKVSEILWASEANESIYHRLRMLIYKLNQDIESKTGIKPFEIRKSQLELNPKIIFRVNE